MPTLFTSPQFKPAPVVTDAQRALSMIIWSKELHERVRRKLFWNKFIGKPVTDEGSLEEHKTGAPIVEYSEFNQKPGAQLVIPIEFNFTENPREDGVVGAEILTGTEEETKYGNIHLFIEEWRKATIVRNVNMQQQRVGIPLVERAVNQLEKSALSFLDNEVTHAFIWGFSANLQRSADITEGNLASSPVKPYAHPNTYYYLVPSGQSKARLVSLQTAVSSYSFDPTGVIYPKPNKATASFSAIDLGLLDELYALLRAKEIPPYQLSDGMEVYIVVMHPYVATLLRNNEKWFNAMTLGMPRGVDNPVFTGSIGHWNNFLFYTSNKIPLYYPLNLEQKFVSFGTRANKLQIFQESGRDYIQLSLTTLTTSNWAGSGNDGDYYEFGQKIFENDSYGTAWVITPIFVLGANAIATAYSRTGPKGYQTYFTLTPSERSDYGKHEAYGMSVVYGFRRIDWLAYDSTTLFNQSSAIVFVGQRIYAEFIPPEFGVGAPE